MHLLPMWPSWPYSLFVFSTDTSLFYPLVDMNTTTGPSAYLYKANSFFCPYNKLNMRRGLLLSERRKRTASSKEKKHAARCSLLRRVRKLKKIVPGCRNAGIDMMLRRASQYIPLLELRVQVLKSLLALCDA